jgi:cellulose synthase/poly-beta-1,6-N-acetylglucosamine synthase-like glycosyltransferase
MRDGPAESAARIANLRAAPLEKRARLGAVLVARGATAADRLDAALAAQPESQARIGAILSARGWAAPGAVAAAAAEQAGLDHADLARDPLDPTLGDEADLPVYTRRRLAPWRRLGAETVWVAVDVADAAAGLAELATPPDRIRLALTDAAAFEEALTVAYADPLARRAAARPPAEMSARTPAPRAKALVAILALCAGIGALAAPGATLGMLFLALVLVNASNGVLRIAAFGMALRERAPPPPPPVPEIAARRRPPKVTLLVPLYREPETAPVLLAALERLDWPPELLDVKLIVEADDETTRAALEAHDPPPFCRILAAPPGAPRTKPRALNFALDFAEGEIVGIYDAEDQPEPDQIRRAVAALQAAPPEVACVQGRLSYFNPQESWLTRCFTLEYALWFDVLLRGFQGLRLPIPLGGTSVFFRRGALERLGGWDAHNVTEDADLGMRLARAGFRCEVLDSTTFEEANGRVIPWIKQRSRWLKGYAQTWMTHMRRPAPLWRDLGPRGFLGFQMIFLGGLTAYFGLPLFWGVWVAALAGAGPSWLGDAPPWLFGALAALHLSAWIATFGAAIVATGRRGLRWLLPWAPTLLLYWPIGAAAAYLALAELAAAPFHWRKTRHGVGRIAAAERERALAERAGRRRVEAA